MNEQQPEALRLADRIDLKDYYEFDASLHCPKAAAELRRLHSVEKAFQQWITKTEWVQKSSQSHELGMHRADVMKQRLEQLLTENQQLRAALDQPQNHVPDARNMVPAGWKLVPVEPTREMMQAWVTEITPKNAWAAMLAAAPQPPIVKESSVVQPQANQPAMTPIAQRKLDTLLAEGYTISGYSIYHEQKHQHGFVTGAGLVGWWKPEGVEYPQSLGEQEPVAWLTIEVMGPRTKVDVEWEDQLQKLPSGIYKLYTHPQPKRQPLTDEEIDKINRSTTWPVKSLASLGDRQWAELLRCAARAIEAAHNIK